MKNKLLLAAQQADWLSKGTDQVLSHSSFVFNLGKNKASGAAIPAIETEKSEQQAKQQIVALVADGLSQEVATIFSLAIGNLAFSRQVLDSISLVIKEDPAGFRQSTIFRVVFVEGEFEAALSLLLELLQSASSASGSDADLARCHGMLMCSHELLYEISKLLTTCRLRESHDMWPSDQGPVLEPVAHLVALNRTILAENAAVGESTEKIARAMGI